MALEDELIALEQERAAALSNKDWDTLAAFTADTFIHTHSSGRWEDKPTWIAGLQKRPRGIERKDLRVWVYGDAAVMSGLQLNRPEGMEIEQDPVTLRVLQLWVKLGQQWQVAASQTTRVKA